METLPVINLPAAHEEVEQAAVRLGQLLADHPLYRRLRQAILDLEKDAQVHDLSVQIQARRNALYSNQGGPELRAELERLRLELEALPAVREYRAAEGDARRFFQAVNALLSEALKIDFASNARRSCGCGG